ncbi:carbohydrate ABC transporter permease [Diaminobutyricibacter tongyongensis]|uniref:Carbohydrate ABC transporter permease n=1 Tax=Leifsonia tongyongensis TaxID=1268043 RepID=A0A6L9XW44_9MICO|nr:carbohydrate ABC transporter permease [Diaminobutyricibacter tongyongensis]NEN05238.1 carbohydrate ABC transporter permease [Diaminobutyricibacter tongyongensis]
MAITQASEPSVRALPRQGVRSGRIRRRISTVTASALLVAFTLLTLLPIYIMVAVSLKTGADSQVNPFALPLHPQWQNYVDAFVNMNYPRSVMNTLIITGGTAVLTIFTASLAAWGIVRYTRKWTRTAYQIFVAGLTIPIFVVITPLYQIMQQLHLLDSYLGVILAYSALTLPFAVFFYAGFLRTVPPELEEAAAVDGCGIIRTYLRVVFPLLRPATATLSIFIVLQVWNDLILPLILLSSNDKQTVTLAVYATIGTHSFSTSELLPTLVLGVIPLFVVFLVLQKYVVAGIAVGSGK